MGLCLSACLSVTSRCSVETAERIELDFGMGVSFHPSYTVLKGNSVTSKNKGTSLWNFVINSTRTLSEVSDKVRGLCLVGTGRASVVEFSYERQLILGSGLVVQVVSALLRGNIIGKISTNTTHSARSLGDS